MSEDEEAKEIVQQQEQDQQEQELYDLVHGGITLNVQGVGNGEVLEHPSVFLSWKFSKELIAKLSDEFCENECKMVAKLLVIYGAVGKLRGRRIDEHRVICDITDPMVSVNFTSSGKNRIVALVVTGTFKSRILDYFLKVENGHYDSHVITGNQSGLFTETPGCGCIDVEIPEGLFAKKPRDWDFVNKMFDSPPRDKCAFKWRRVVVYPVQALRLIGVPIIWSIGLIMVCAFLLLGFNGVGYGILHHPANESIDEIWEGITGSIFVPKIRGFYLPICLLFSPFFLLAFALLVMNGHATLATVSAISVSLLLVGITAIPLLLGYWTGKQTKAQASFDHILSGLSGCTPPAKVSELPFRPRNVRLFYENAKRKMCRGFSS